jgi:hypothetical protein
VNALVAAVAPGAAVRAEAGKIVVADRTFEGTEHRLIALVPGRAAGEHGPAHPAYLLYAGAGMPGVTEINSVPHGVNGVLVADRFGALLRGKWELSADKAPRLDLGTPVNRAGWAPGAPGEEGDAVTFSYLRKGEPGLDVQMAERQIEQACRRGVETARARLGIQSVAPPLHVHLYPDARVKREWTGRSADGHVDILSRTLHVRIADPIALEHLVAHEATHLLVDGWGPVATPCVGEGIAVWVAGGYGGKTLDDWAKAERADVPKVADLLGPQFRRFPEPVTYPLSGLLLEALVAKVRVDGVRERFLSATAATWADACSAAGTTAEEVEKAWLARMGK